MKQPTDAEIRPSASTELRAPGEPSHGETIEHRARASLDRAVEHLATIQDPRGGFAGEVWWNNMLACQYVIMCRVLGQSISSERRQRIHRTLAVQQTEDGGWGMHAHAGTWMFHTTLGYVALRLLGYDHSDPLVASSLQWIRNNGGVRSNPTWGRVWLAMLGLYPWHAVSGIVPELWLLPDSSPLHPRRLYCHMRLIYLGLSCVWGLKIRAKPGPDLDALRSELYPQGYDEAEIYRRGTAINQHDLFEAPGPLLALGLRISRRLGRLCPTALRQRAIARALEHIRFEFESTDYVCLSPVNGMLFALVLAHQSDDKETLQRAIKGLEYWVWEDDDEGFRIAGAKSDIWDTSFLLQALCMTPENKQVRELVHGASTWLKSAQLRSQLPGAAAHYRAPTLGGWGFADENHPWPVSDCTAEALEALLDCESQGLCETPLSLDRKIDAVRFILLRRNADGGFGSYEARRGGMWLRRFNPAEIYGNCMLEYSYVECTASCIRGLANFRAHHSTDIDAELRREIDATIDAGVEHILREQQSNGAWAGFWGINFCYGTYFSVLALLSCGISREHAAIRRAVGWLRRHQRSDGGWAESCAGLLDTSEQPVPDLESSNATQTAWALCALIEAAPELAEDNIETGIRFLLHRQTPEGTWQDQRPTGVFFNTAVLDYRLYSHQFPWLH